MRLDRLSLRGFRNYAEATVELGPGVTALVGRNGQGKTNVLEAVAYLATLRSFRSAPGEVMVRAGEERAVLRAEGARGPGREVLIEAELSRTGRSRVQVNRSRLSRASDLVGVLTTTVFTPDDLAIVKAGPAARRDLLDDALVARDPRFEGARAAFERALRQRNALLKQVSGGPLSAEAELTLSVWDSKLAPLAEAIVSARSALVDRLAPAVRQAYADLAQTDEPIDVAYHPTVPIGEMADALAGARREELRRAVTLVGPHRDDLSVMLRGQPARAFASQGEQRSLALSLKLAVHRLLTAELGEAPLLLLDDVFSELDPHRAAALVAHLPSGQTLLTTADRVPPGAVIERRYVVEAGTLREVA